MFFSARVMLKIEYRTCLSVAHLLAKQSNGLESYHEYISTDSVSEDEENAALQY
jgi:hypothetical protein